MADPDDVIDDLIGELSEAKKEIERLRAAAGCADLIIKLMCVAFDIEPEDFVVNLTADAENGERKTIKKVSAQQILDQVRAAIGEEE